MNVYLPVEKPPRALRRRDAAPSGSVGESNRNAESNGGGGGGGAGCLVVRTRSELEAPVTWTPRDPAGLQVLPLRVR